MQTVRVFSLEKPLLGRQDPPFGGFCFSIAFFLIINYNKFGSGAGPHRIPSVGGNPPDPSLLLFREAGKGQSQISNYNEQTNLKLQ